MKIIDAHTHIDYITSNFQPYVVGCVCCATNESDWKKIIDLCDKDNRVCGAFGLHPWFVDCCDNMVGARLEHLLNMNHDYMVGEIGLDKYKPNMDKQLDIFIMQLNTAIKLKRTVFLHCVGAWDKILHILKQYKKSELPIIVAHDFNGNQNIIEQLLQYENIYFSFSKNVIRAENCRIEQIPSNRILIESDGKQDISLVDVINEIAKIKNEPGIDEFIYNNTKRILRNE